MKTIHLNPGLRQDLQRRCKQTLDKRIYQRLTAVLLLDAGKTRFEAAALLQVSVRQLADWLRTFRNQGVEVLCTLRYQGDPGKMTAAQVEQLKQEVGKGRFRNANQIRQWLEETFQILYSLSGVKDLLRRIGVTYHKVTGFLWKAQPEEQRKFVKKYRRQKRFARRPGAVRTRFYFVDGCHPVWGLDLVYSCWLLRGQRLLKGMGSGRKRLNILGAYCPDDHEYLDLRLTRDNINGEQFVNLLRLLRAAHPEVEKFVLSIDGAAYYGKPIVEEWLRRHPEFHLERLPTYSPNLNLIERLWKFLKGKALKRWHKTFAAMQEAVSEVLDHLDRYQAELTSLMAEHFHIVAESEIPVEYREVA
jgi:transposase